MCVCTLFLAPFPSQNLSSCSATTSDSTSSKERDVKDISATQNAGLGRGGGISISISISIAISIYLPTYPPTYLPI